MGLPLTRGVGKSLSIQLEDLGIGSVYLGEVTGHRNWKRICASPPLALLLGLCLCPVHRAQARVHC